MKTKKKKCIIWQIPGLLLITGLLLTTSFQWPKSAKNSVWRNETGKNITQPEGLEIKDLKKPRNIYFEEELPVKIAVKITKNASRLEVQTINYFKQTVFRDTLNIDGIQEVSTLLLKDLHYGYFVSGFSLKDRHDEVVSYTEIPFCVIRKPKNWGRFDPESRFGFHGTEDPVEMEAMERMGMKWNRIYHWWRNDQPEKQGKINTERFRNIYDFNRKYHMNMVMNIRPGDPPKWAIGESYPDNIGYWNDYVRYFVNHGKNLGVVWEIGNEPDLKLKTILESDLKRTGEVYRDFAFSAAGIIREIDPGSEIIVCSTAGMHMGRTGFPYTETSFKKLHEVSDIFGIHSYTGPRLVGESGSFISPEEKNNRGRFHETFDMVRKYSDRHVIWNTECGYAIDAYNDAFIDEHNQTFTSLTARMFITSFSVPGVEKVFHFRTAPYSRSSGTDYGLFRNLDNYPRPLVPMFSHMAWIMHHANPLDKPVREDDIQLFPFRTNDNKGLVVAYKHKGEPETMILNVDHAELYVTDIMGNELDVSRPDNKSGIQLTNQPVYIKSKTLSPGKLEELFYDAEYQLSELVSISNVYANTMNEFSVVLANNSGVPAKVEVSASAPDGLVFFESEKVIILEPNEKSEVKFYADLKGSPLELNNQSITVKAVSNMSKSEYTHTIGFIPLPYCEIPVNLNNLDGFKPRLKHFSFRGKNSVSPPDPGIDWDNNSDLSADIYFGWDTVALYIAAEVNDDIHHNNQPADDLINGDAILVALDTKNDAKKLEPGYDNNDYEIIAALAKDSVCVNAVYVPEGKDKPYLNKQIQARIIQKNRQTIYQYYPTNLQN